MADGGYEERFVFEGDDGAPLARLVQNSGLLYRINNTVLHEAGLMLGVVAERHDARHNALKVIGLTLVAVDDPSGVIFPEEAHERGRDRLRRHGFLHPIRDLMTGDARASDEVFVPADVKIMVEGITPQGHRVKVWQRDQGFPQVEINGSEEKVESLQTSVAEGLVLRVQSGEVRITGRGEGVFNERPIRPYDEHEAEPEGEDPGVGSE